jgi:hypothetical protein
MQCRMMYMGTRCIKTASPTDSICAGHCIFPESDGDATVHPQISVTPKVSNPESYYRRGGMEVKGIIKAFDLGYNVGTAVAYLLRAGKKPGNSFIDDVTKARDHLGFEIDAHKKG